MVRLCLQQQTIIFTTGLDYLLIIIYFIFFYNESVNGLVGKMSENKPVPISQSPQ